MIKKSVLGIGISCLLATMVFAQASNCGDGDQRYTQEDGPVIRYFATINDFNIVRITEDTVTIQDQVDCRYGRDTLVNIDSIEFLDKTVNVLELEVHEQTRELGASVIQKLLSDILVAQIRSRGVDPLVEDQVAPPQVVAQEGVVSDPISSSFISSRQTVSVLPSNITNPTVLPTITNNGVQSVYTGPTHGTYSQLNNPYFYPYNNQLGIPPAPGNIGSLDTRTSLLGEPSVVVTWPISAVDSTSVVYFETTDSNHQHHYLGSAPAFLGSHTLPIPSHLLAESSLTIHVRNGARVITQAEVSLSDRRY